MSDTNPMERFVSGFGKTLRDYDIATADLSISDADDAVLFVQARQELQMATWAVDIATKRRHGLLKKIMTEIR